MSKKNDSPAIEVGKPITIEAASRQEATEKLNALREQAKGLTAQGGFIEYDGRDKFSAVIMFNK